MTESANQMAHPKCRKGIDKVKEDTISALS